jgi:hypothetical protein
MPTRASGIAACVLALAVAACGQGPGPGSTPEASATPDDAGYLAPPSLTGADRGEGRVQLSGIAPPGAEVRLASPEGALLAATAGGDGRWTLDAPIGRSPGMYAFSAVAGDRTLRGEGALLVGPPPGPPALLLRAGFGAQSFGAGGTSPTILAVDYDVSGGAAVAGHARPGAAVRLSLDGAPAGFGQTDVVGRFAVTATNRTLAPGRRVIDVETADGRAQVVIEASSPAPLQGPYRATRVEGAWRIDWTPPGGGVQTSVIFDLVEGPA